MIARPGFMKNIADGYTTEGFPAFSLMKAKTILINVTGIFAVGGFNQMLTRVAFDDPATGPAVRAKSLPRFKLPLL